MTAGGPRRIDAFLTGGLSRAVSAYLDETTRLRAIWHTHVSEPLASHTHPVRTAGGRLVVQADTPVWASRLRQQQFTLLSQLIREPALRHLEGLTVKVVPRSVGPDPNSAASPPARRPPFSSATGRLLKSVATGIENSDLRTALLRLSELSSDTSTKAR